MVEAPSNLILPNETREKTALSPRLNYVIDALFKRKCSTLASQRMLCLSYFNVSQRIASATKETLFAGHRSSATIYLCGVGPYAPSEVHEADDAHGSYSSWGLPKLNGNPIDRRAADRLDSSRNTSVRPEVLDPRARGTAPGGGLSASGPRP